MENNSLLRTDKELAELYQRHADGVYRLCYIYLKHSVDAEDAVQSVFLKLIKSQMIFNDYEHEKAWLTVTARNYCKDVLKNWWKTRRGFRRPAGGSFLGRRRASGGSACKIAFPSRKIQNRFISILFRGVLGKRDIEAAGAQRKHDPNATIKRPQSPKNRHRRRFS